MRKNIINRVYDALYSCAGQEWFGNFFGGNLDLHCLGAGKSLVFLKFDGEERYFSVADLGREPIKQGTDDPRIGEIKDATIELVTQYLGITGGECDTQVFMFWDYDGDNKHYWLLAEVDNITPQLQAGRCSRF